MTSTDSTERKQVLEMLAEGRISVDDAQRLIDKLQEVESRRQEEGAGGAGPRVQPRHLRIVSSDGEEEGLNLRIPLGLVRAGLTLESFLPSWVPAGIFAGTSFSDLHRIDNDYLRENLDELDLSFDSEDGESLRIFVE